MKRLLKSFKTEINPTEEQKARIRRTIGTCRYVYNFYLGHNKALHDNGEKFMTGKDFSLWLNNEYIPDNPDKTWIREVYSKAVKKSIEDGCTAVSYTHLDVYKRQDPCCRCSRCGQNNGSDQSSR